MVETEIQQCWWDNNAAAPSEYVTVGEMGVTRIVLKNDGNGPMGYYDRIHVFNESGRHLTYPAHHVSGWSSIPTKAEGRDDG